MSIGVSLRMGPEVQAAQEAHSSRIVRQRRWRDERRLLCNLSLARSCSRSAAYRELGHHNRTVAVRGQLQSATKLPEPLLHPVNADTGFSCGCECCSLFGPNASSGIPNFDGYVVVQASDTNCRGWTTRMTMHVGKAFLHHAKDAGLHVCRQPAEMSWKLQLRLDTAALRESVDEPLEGRGEPNFIK